MSIKQLRIPQRATNVGEALEHASKLLDYCLDSDAYLEVEMGEVHDDLILAISWLKKESPEVLAIPLIR